MWVGACPRAPCFILIVRLTNKIEEMYNYTQNQYMTDFVQYSDIVGLILFACVDQYRFRVTLYKLLFKRRQIFLEDYL